MVDKGKAQALWGESEMTNDFKCPDGWEETLIHSFDAHPNGTMAKLVLLDGWEYKILRRKKPKPMPELKAGYLFTESLTGEVHTVMRVDGYRYWTCKSNFRYDKTIDVGYWHREDITKIWDNNGQLIWERGT